MDAQTLNRIRPELTRYLHEFDGCFKRITSRRHLDSYVAGQLGDLKRKTVEPIADSVGTPPRTLQEFLSLFRWDESSMRDRVAQRIARRHSHPQAICVIDETRFLKKGNKTACVQRRANGEHGRVENCVISVHLGYTAPNFHTLLDADLYLPEQTWHRDRERCREAGIPDDVGYRPKWQIALDQVRRAMANSVRFAWITFDAEYASPRFMIALSKLGQNFAASVPPEFSVATSPPDAQRRAPAGPPPGARSDPTCVEVQQLANDPTIARAQPWHKYYVQDDTGRTAAFQAARLQVWFKDDAGEWSGPQSLVITRDAGGGDLRFFLSNAPGDTTIHGVLQVAMSGPRLRRQFAQSKAELGMNHFEVRKYISIRRHLILSCVSHLFLAEHRQRMHLSGEPSPVAAPAPALSQPDGAPLVERRPAYVAEPAPPTASPTPAPAATS